MINTVCCLFICCFSLFVSCYVFWGNENFRKLNANFRELFLLCTIYYNDYLRLIFVYFNFSSNWRFFVAASRPAACASLKNASAAS